MNVLDLVRHVDPEFGKRLPPNLLERALILPVRALTALIRWLSSLLP